MSAPNPFFSAARSLLLCSALLITSFAFAEAPDLSDQYSWQPVEIGAGGLVTGIVNHPRDAKVRYIRTDVGGAYRWDDASGRWVQMVRRTRDAGFPAEQANAPTDIGVDSIAVDPSDPKVVYVAMRFNRPKAVTGQGIAANFPGSVYRSADGGLNFTKTNLAVGMAPNERFWRGFGERLAVDPRDGKRLFFGSLKEGLWRSTDGMNWTRLTTGGAPAANANVLGVRIPESGAGRLVYAIVAAGDVFRSDDGGDTWKNISAGTGLSGKAANSVLDSRGRLWVGQHRSRTAWFYDGAVWVSRNTRLAQDLVSLAVDPANPNRVFALATNGAVSRSTDGANFVSLSPRPLFAGTQGWLPQPVSPNWHGASNIAFDAAGDLWISQGNEGVLHYRPLPGDPESPENPPHWSIRSLGIEEMVTHQVIAPKGGGGRVYAAFHDTGGFVITDPATVDGARWIPLQDQLISNGTSVAAAPGSPSYVALSNSDVNNAGKGRSYSGYTTDGGDTWSLFAGNSNALQCGFIAVSRRDGWGDGADRLVLLPGRNRAPHYSHDGGATWTRSESFPEKEKGGLVGFTGFWNLALKQHSVMADPFAPGKFYLKFVGGGFWISTDSGVTWTLADDKDLPAGTHHGQLMVNENVRDELWYASGWDGSYDPETWKWENGHGLWRSTDGGKAWAKVTGPRYAITAALGAGRGQRGDAPYTVYFYGLLVGDEAFGIFRSTDAGATWARVSYFPDGRLDTPTAMAASWDEFGPVYVGFNGTSLMWGRPVAGSPSRK
jgi:photosystem II stability/assembly factor-like uncharacterized protein